MQAHTNNGGQTTVRDGARQFRCGVIEGFYGPPWTADQRKDLFSRMKQLGMNTYMYAPKDDLKHRTEWRQLYTNDEAELLQSLIQIAKSENITFVYALSPGIDIVYSSEKEIKSLHEKSEQVRCLGCEAFALLFDDIDATLSDADKKKFSSIAVAQHTVANALYEYLKCPYFFFCPTEYCESRASPSLDKSDYLNTIGKKLLADIQILWTGPRVISREITIEHIRRVSEVLQRKPIIWDNLHANDYDPKRVFLGPFSGRSVRLKEEIAGLLLNPNCRYEANFIPLYTLSAWRSCHDDAEIEEEATSDAILEAGDVVPVAAHIVENASPKRLYHPLKALDEALKKWIDHFYIESPSIAHPAVRIEGSRTILGNQKPSTSGVSVVARGLKHGDNAESQTIVYFNAEATSENETLNSLSAEYSETMDLAPNIKDDVKSVTQNDENKIVNHEMSEVSSDVSMDSSTNSESESMTVEQLSVLVDIFYLPFEHGRRANEMFREFSWLNENSFVMRKNSAIENEFSDEKLHAIVSDEWRRRCDDFVKMLRDVTKLYMKITEVPNRNVVQELFQYVYDAQSITSVVEGLILWIAQGCSKCFSTEFDFNWPNNASVLDAEPWTLSGGFLSDFQKMLFMTLGLADLFLLKAVFPLSLNCYSVRPYAEEDEKQIRRFYNTEEDEFAICAGILGETGEERFFDESLGAFIYCASPRITFVALRNESSESDRIVAVVSAALDAKNFADKVRRHYIPRIRSKYNAYAEIENRSLSTYNEEEVKHSWQKQQEAISDWQPPNLSEYFYERYPSQLEISCRDVSEEIVALRRLICVASVALAHSGSSGFFVVLKAKDSEKIGLFSKLGLATLEEAGVSKKLILMGHSL